VPEIEVMTAADWDRVREIYLEGIATGNATFEQDAPSWEKWDASHLSDCRVIASGACMGDGGMWL
jgi:L-amino acid N-acyltransferase YncA